ncbi:nuclear transport factor 2 family protein [Novosphingobium sp. CCH12-A3]|uniref:nuclear transport factor 2 family protein n=1 Tax=Novosphingobium sp. CCH12-A3 TaxID=1768752 RepID=UPI000A58C191|nr:nuclear transport factor 2 family protein [Novosphingobium sp. CCH12-A3]
MALALPAPIQAYFNGNPDFDVEAMLAPFANDAIVRDEKKELRGTAAIRAWIGDATVGSKAISTPLSIESDGDRHEVSARVAGDFKGSPVTLNFAFLLRDSRIAELEIG